ncbi:plasmid segregation protein ParM [Erwinia sp.]|uniref:plasmid segregation protein ParM n=1 Tax=Erwinia citreus TaxID=558 RepID=UPI002897803F|nr:plasmid segregation protein ParM [Erwinia sp.]
MKIFVDDGSTNIKIAYSLEGEKKTFISPNSFKRGWSVAFGDKQIFNYTLDGENYTFDPISPDALSTTNVAYQYGDINVIAIHHALLKSGLEPQDVELVVTLPLAEYYDKNNQPDEDKIKRKISNVMRTVSLKNGSTFNVKDVSVLPESIPAGFEVVKKLDPTQSLLIVDLGGTTLDISQVQGKMTGISEIYGDSKVGVSIMTDAVKEALSIAKTQGSSYLADDIIIHRNDPAYLKKRINDESHITTVEKAIKESEARLINRTLGAVSNFNGYTHVMVIGGGAAIVADAIRKDTTVQKDRFFVAEDPQFALVNGLFQIG